MTNRASLLFASVPLAVLAACGDNIIITERPTTATSGASAASGAGITAGAGAGSSGVGAGSSGVGPGSTGVGPGSTTSSTGSTSSTGAGAGGAPCAGWIDLVLDNGAPEHLASACTSTGAWNPNGSTTAIGYKLGGAVQPSMIIAGCASTNSTSEGINFATEYATGPGYFTQGEATYTDPMGGMWNSSGDAYQITFTKVGPVGDTIEGTFATKVHQSLAYEAHTVTGSFHVCHVPDEIVP